MESYDTFKGIIDHLCLHWQLTGHDMTPLGVYSSMSSLTANRASYDIFRGNVVPVIDNVRFLGHVCYSICGILAYLIWMETRDYNKLGNTSFICVALLLEN